jgi:predicted amidohydrolase
MRAQAMAPQELRLQRISEHLTIGSTNCSRCCPTADLSAASGDTEPRQPRSSTRSSSAVTRPEVGAAAELRVAAVQISGYDKGDLPHPGYDPVEQLLPYIQRAGRDGVDLVVFPEYVLGHIAVPGPSTQQIAAAAKAAGVYIIVGCWEVAGDRLLNTALLFDRAGAIAGKYHKTHAAVDSMDGSQPPWTAPPAGKSREWLLENDPEWVMERGQDLPVFVLEDIGLRVGILTCYDGWFPEPARELSLRGAEIIVWINGRGGSVEDFIVQTTMFQSHVAMIATNQAYGAGTMIGGNRAESDVSEEFLPAVSSP